MVGLEVRWRKAGSGRHTSVVANKCAQHGDDGGLVTGGVLHDALQCVDAAEPDVHRGWSRG